MTVSNEKKLLRAHYLALRTSIPTSEKEQLDAALCRGICTLPIWEECDLVLGFHAVNGEPDLAHLYRLALERGKKIAFPRCEGRQMRFHLAATAQRPTAGRFGIPTPPETAPLAIPTARTLCILPALAATRGGARLGYGGGFYDRYLSDFSGIGVLPIYSSLICDKLPQEQTDLPADYILTEKGVLHGA